MTTTTTTDQLRDQVTRLAEDLERLERLATDTATEADVAWLDANADDEGISTSEDDGVWAHLWERPLEVVHHATRRSDTYEWTYSHTVVVFSTGGPHIELNTETHRLTGWWGSDTVERRVDEAVSAFYEDGADGLSL